MRWLLGVSFGELMLKGKNRKKFINNSIKQVLKALHGFNIGEHFLDHEKLFIEVLDTTEFPAIIEKSTMVFGLSYVYPCIQCEKNFEDIEKSIIELINDKNYDGKKSFKAFAVRADKSFEMNSMQIAAKVGGMILRHFDNFHVDIKNPEVQVHVDIRQRSYVYLEKHSTIGGLPIGTGGRALLLLSGGIDSPVAGFEMARRGVEIGAIHFHSYPFTSERAKDKARRLAKQMSIYVGEVRYFEINMLNIYTAINKNCRERFTTILSRRFMMRIAEKLAEKYRFDGFVTGEALGQVASQTIQSISVVNDATRLPIFRPLINMDKSEIIEKAKWIDTYDISIEPYDDCCSFFAPERPVTKPRLYDIEAEEAKLNIDELVEKALETLEIFDIIVE